MLISADFRFEGSLMGEKTIRISEIVYLVYFAVMFGARAAGLYEGMLIYNISLVIGMLLFAAKILCTRHTVFEYIVIAALLGVSLIVYKNSGEKGMLLYMTMMLGMKGVKLQRVERLGMAILGVCFPVLVFISVTGIREDIAYFADGRRFFGEIMRRSLGYPYFNTMFTTFVVLVVLIMLSKGYQSVVPLLTQSIFLMVVGVYLYIYSCSNTGLIILTLFLFVNFIMQSKKKVSKFEGALILLIYPICMFISIVLPILIRGELFGRLDKIFHNRFNYANYFLTHEKVTLFGSRFAPTPNDNYLIDSSFLYSFLQIGVVPCVILTTLMCTMIYMLIKDNRRIELAVCISFCVLGLSDPFFFNLSYKNLMFLFVGDYFYKNFDMVKCKLPPFLTREICIFGVGEKKIEYHKWPVYAAWKKVFRAFYELFEKRGITNLVTFLIIFVIMFVVSLSVFDPDAITGAVDVIPEWEYVRETMSFGLFGAVFITLIIAKVRDFMKHEV